MSLLQAKSCPMHTSRLIPGTENNENCYKSLFSCLDYLGQITWNDENDNNDDDGNDDGGDDDGDHDDVSIHTSSICRLFIYKESLMLTYSKRAILTLDCYSAFSSYLRSLIMILFLLMLIVTVALDPQAPVMIVFSLQPHWAAHKSIFQPQHTLRLIKKSENNPFG